MRTAESTALDPAFDLDIARAVLREHPIRLAILFGSHATETTHATSDIDIAVEFADLQPSQPSYNDVFLGLSADLSETLATDDVDLVDIHAVSPPLAAAIFDNGVLLVGEQEHAIELRRRLVPDKSENQSPRERLTEAIDRIDAHLDDTETGVPASGDAKQDE